MNSEKENKIDGGLDTGNKNEDIQRITVSKQVQDTLAAIVERVNDGFAGGRVNRTQMANWILLKYSERLDDAEVKEVRTNHFDEITLLESILRQAKVSGIVPAELKALLQKQVVSDEQPKKKSRKVLTENNINDVI